MNRKETIKITCQDLLRCWKDFEEYGLIISFHGIRANEKCLVELGWTDRQVATFEALNGYGE